MSRENRLVPRIVAMLALMVAACEAMPSDLAGGEARGEDVAARLLERFNDTATGCLDSAVAPAFLCSGVILRPSKVTDQRLHAWNPTPEEQVSGGMAATILRRDMGFSKLARGDTHGLVLYPALGTPAGKLRPEVVCVFPAYARSEERDKPGCGRHPTYYNQTRYCQGQGIATAGAWLAHVRLAPGGDIGRYQCSFDVRKTTADTTRIFAQVPLIRTALAEHVFGEAPELLYATWPSDVSTQVPVEAVFYIAGSSGLTAAQSDQRDFFHKSGGSILPIIRITLPTRPGGDAEFDFLVSDQMPLSRSGAALADDLEARVRSTVTDCGGATRPVFLCTGVLLRATRAGNYHAWMPSPKSAANRGMSFTYLRHDFPVQQLYQSNGFVTYPQFAAPDARTPAHVRCIYPVDGWTGARSDACGPSSNYPAASKPCQDHVPPIVTAKAWVAHFQSVASSLDVSYRHSHQCGFRMDMGTPASAAIFLEAAKGMALALADPADEFTRYNEMIVQPWAADIGAKVPVEAFFYVAGQDGLKNAQADQKDFQATLGIRLPIVRLALPVQVGRRAFEFDPADQVVPYP